MTIWKFPLATTDWQRVTIPVDAELLDVQVQAGTPCLWAIVDPSKEKEQRLLRIIGTGHTFTDEGLAYIASYQLGNGALVFHVFEKLQRAHDGDTKPSSPAVASANEKETRE